MILIITHKGDFTVDFVIDKLNKQKIKYFRFNCEDIDKRGYTFRSNSKYSFELAGIDKTFTSVWFRRTKLPNIDITSRAEKLFVLNDYDTLLSNFYQVIDSKRWLSHPQSVYLAENKLLQIKIANRLGFKIPDTLVTSNPNELRAFALKHNNRIIIKPISQGRITEEGSFKNIFTNLVNKKHIEKLDQFDLTPAIFQQYIDKEYELRVTIVDKEVFSAKVDSQTNENTKVDWRKEKLKFYSYSLPEEIEQKCINLVHRLNLKFGAIDLIKTPEGEYVFLEINPNGQWAWIEFDTGQKISTAIIKYLKEA